MAACRRGAHGTCGSIGAALAHAGESAAPAVRDRPWRQRSGVRALANGYFVRRCAAGVLHARRQRTQSPGDAPSGRADVNASDRHSRCGSAVLFSRRRVGRLLCRWRAAQDPRARRCVCRTRHRRSRSRRQLGRRREYCRGVGQRRRPVVDSAGWRRTPIDDALEWRTDAPLAASAARLEGGDLHGERDVGECVRRGHD